MGAEHGRSGGDEQDSPEVARKIAEIDTDLAAAQNLDQLLNMEESEQSTALDGAVEASGSQVLEKELAGLRFKKKGVSYAIVAVREQLELSGLSLDASAEQILQALAERLESIQLEIDARNSRLDNLDK